MNQTSESVRKADYPIDNLFINRWSPRSFLDKDVPEDTLYSVFEAARWAPSASNNQPCRFIIARTEADKENFYSFIYEGNLVWCKRAPVLAAILSKKSVEGNPNLYHAFDTGTAWGHLALQASMKGLITHAMGGFDRDAARKALNVPEDYDIQAIIAIGYQGPKDVLPENYQEREAPTPRRPLNELLFEGKFSNI
ncbi:nitroreductase [Pullulanibacillus camelliae]|uniref:Nitroreductase n=1 Tax=Pullulanibacillus camelliae TaxID=1707096 RepID=A0A8J3DUF7_9BACL|nr:nitroreductase family protein [Pullulanibacillus camelliae]GGE43282.1 nitroreductase [Pullulanibacillus camelliae]